MAEETVKRVTGLSPMFPPTSDMSSNSVPFSSRSSPSEVTSDAAVVAVRVKTNNRLPEIAPAALPAKVAGASMQWVASLEHLQKRICGGQTPHSPQWDATVGWNPALQGSKEQN